MKRYSHKIGFRIFVRLMHTLLVTFIPISLLWKRTELYDMIFKTSNIFPPLCYIFIWTIGIFAYHLTWWIGPGYIPVPQKPYNIDSDDDDTASMLQAEEGISKVFRKCGFCGVKQPLRVRHCEDCERCIRKFDHHCPWFETCIGELNHRFFLIFLIATDATALWSTKISWNGIQNKEGIGNWIAFNWIFVFDLFWLVFGVIALTGLAGLHTFLAVTNRTTWEVISRERIRYLKHFAEDKNPFHEGYICNIAGFFCRLVPRNWEKLYFKGTSTREA